MRTPKEYTNNVKNGIITKRMLSDCLFSVNKRAKNCRDKEASYRYSYDKYNTEERYRDKKEDYYRQKEKMLSLLKPDCIHQEPFKCKKRIYDYEPEYYDFFDSSSRVYEGCYYDRDMREDVFFIDVLMDDSRYYLFYDLGEHSFHTPISSEEIKYYQELEIKEIGSLITYGKEIGELISTQFVQKIIALIDSGEYRLELS